MSIRERIAEEYPELLCLEPEYFDRAIIGIVERIGTTAICYNKRIVIELLMSEDDMDYETAMEHFSFNVSGGWVGDSTPFFLDDFDVEVGQTTSAS